jgi:hypothetical protein
MGSGIQYWPSGLGIVMNPVIGDLFGSVRATESAKWTQFATYFL